MFPLSLLSGSLWINLLGNTDNSAIAATWIYIFAAAVVLCFLAGELTLNYSQTDKLWSLMPVIYSWTAVSYNPSELRLWLMASLVTIWGVRLTYNFYRKGGYSLIPWKGEEDYRWKYLRQHPLLKSRWRFGLFNLFFISFYQHFLILLFSSPLLIAASGEGRGINAIDITAAVMMGLFIILETIADNQQYRFQMQKKKMMKSEKKFSESLKKGFLTEGLWKYVRHPNYVAEQAIWVSFYFFGVAAQGRLLNWTLAGPVLLILLFTGSTKLTEKISRTRYPAFNEYIKNVPCYFPAVPGSRKHQSRKKNVNG